MVGARHATVRRLVARSPAQVDVVDVDQRRRPCVAGRVGRDPARTGLLDRRGPPVTAQGALRGVRRDRVEVTDQDPPARGRQRGPQSPLLPEPPVAPR